MRRFILVIGMFLLAAGIGVGVVVAIDPLGGEEPANSLSPEEAATELAAERAGVVPLGYQVPTLTDEDIPNVRQILQTDPALLAALKGHQFTVSSIGVWHEGPNKIGAVAIIQFGEPPTLENDWSVVRFVEDGSPDYSIETYRVLAEDIEEMLVLIDLRVSEVVSIQPTRTGDVINYDPIPTRTVPGGN